MAFWYLCPAGNPNQVLMGQDTNDATKAPFTAPSGFTWIQGPIPQGATQYIEPDPHSGMKTIMRTVDTATRGQYAVSIAAVDDFLIEQDWEGAKDYLLLLEPQLPSNLQPLIPQLLNCLPPGT